MSMRMARPPGATSERISRRSDSTCTALGRCRLARASSIIGWEAASSPTPTSGTRRTRRQPTTGKERSVDQRVGRHRLLRDVRLLSEQHRPRSPGDGLRRAVGRGGSPGAGVAAGSRCRSGHERHRGPAHTAASGAADGRRLVLRRPLWSRGHRGSFRHAAAAASAHGAADGELAGRRRRAAPRQPRQRADDPAWAAQPDDLGPGHLAFGGVTARACARAAWRPAVGGAPER
jgi:hypothetical protein